MIDEIAAQDVKRYVDALMQWDGHTTCLAIERKYGLYGYPPEVVMVGLRAAEQGESVDDAIDNYLEPDGA